MEDQGGGCWEQQSRYDQSDSSQLSFVSRLEHLRLKYRAFVHQHSANYRCGSFCHVLTTAQTVNALAALSGMPLSWLVDSTNAYALVLDALLSIGFLDILHGKCDPEFTPLSRH